MTTRLRDAWDVLLGRKYATTCKLTVRNGGLMVETGQPLTPEQADRIRHAFESESLPPHRHQYQWQPSGRGIGFDCACACGRCLNFRPVY